MLSLVIHDNVPNAVAKHASSFAQTQHPTIDSTVVLL